MSDQHKPAAVAEGENPFIGGAHTYATVTDKIAAIALTRRGKRADLAP